MIAEDQRRRRFDGRDATLVGVGIEGIISRRSHLVATVTAAFDSFKGGDNRKWLPGRSGKNFKDEVGSRHLHVLLSAVVMCSGEDCKVF
jgi:hypothetical protein